MVPWHLLHCAAYFGHADSVASLVRRKAKLEAMDWHGVEGSGSRSRGVCVCVCVCKGVWVGGWVGGWVRTRAFVYVGGAGVGGWWVGDLESLAAP